MKRRRFTAVVLVAVAAVVLAGCATIISGTKQDVLINSAPGKAEVLIKSSAGFDITKGITPFAVRLARKNAYIVTVTLAGYEKKEIMIDKGFNPVFLGNILCGGLIGVIVDFVTGAVYKLEPDQVLVTLERVGLYNRDGDLMLVLYAYNDEGQLIRYMSPMIRSLPEVSSP